MTKYHASVPSQTRLLFIPSSGIAAICLGQLLETLLALSAGIGCECCTDELGELGVASCFIRGLVCMCLKERLSTACVVGASVEAGEEKAQLLSVLLEVLEPTQLWMFKSQ